MLKIDREASEAKAQMPQEPLNKSKKYAIDADTKFDAVKTAFERLPDEIIEQILLLTTPNSFASLTILNSKWRKVSQQAYFYADQLSHCPSYAAAHQGFPVPDEEEGLPRLRRLFAKEVKRNLFDAYLRPKETVISLVSTSISSSSAPGGEAFHFSISPRGHYVLAYSSSRIHVLDVTGPEVEVKRELKILRRPASTTITDDGYILAVLSTDLQVDLYDLRSKPPRHTRAVALDHTPRTIALSPTGSVLACAYDAGVEVSSLDTTSATIDRRAVKCYAVDSLSFSQDGTQLLGSTLQSRDPSTVILTAPYYDPGGSLPEDAVSALWTTSILFPNGSRDCSHAVLLPNPSDGESSWTFTYDRVFETFRAVRIDDLRNGTTYFTGPIADSTSISKLLPSTLPSASESGDLVAAGFQGAIWLYGIPEDLDAVNIRDAYTSSPVSEASTPSTQLGRQNSAHSTRSVNRPRDANARAPQWQLLCDRFRNTFVEGRKITLLAQVSAMSWVDECSTLCHAERLVAVAPGVGSQPMGGDDDGMAPVDGGRISILDFKYSTTDGKRQFVTVEVGDREPEVLEEEHRDLDTEVAIVRRRTVAQRRGNRSHVSRSVTTAARVPRVEPPPMPTLRDIGDPFVPITLPIRRPSQQTVTSEQSETTSMDEDHDAFDAPYSHTSPRSGTTLRRAATAAAVNRRLHPRAVAQDHIEYRRADGREEHPHESDADNWVPPPPPYTREPLPPLPEHIQRSIQAEAVAATLQRSSTQRSPNSDFAGLDMNALHRSRTVASSSTSDSRRDRLQFQRAVSDSTVWTADRVSMEEDMPRPVTSPQSGNYDDLYDVSPANSAPSTPPLRPQTDLPAAVRTAPLNSIPRRPVGAPATNNISPQSTRSSSSMQGTSQQHSSPTQQQFQARHENLDRSRELWNGADVTQQTLDVTTESQVSSMISPGTSSFEDSRVPAQSVSGAMEESVSNITPLNKVVPASSTPKVQTEQHQVLHYQPTPLTRRAETAPVAATVSQSMDNDLVPTPRRSETTPITPRTTPMVTITQGNMVMPSADQLARLNSRRGRPTGLSDPRRLSGGSSIPQRTPSGGHNRNVSSGSMQSTPPRLTPEQSFLNRPTVPRAAAGAHGSPSRQGLSPQAPSQNQYSTSPSRRLSGNSHHRSPSSGSPGLRPPMQRLETIHSQSSAVGEPSPFLVSRAMMVSRQPSRAEKGAAKNMKDAKKKGWRSSMKSSKKDKYGDGASSAGWTDVTREGSMADRSGKKDKSGKCSVM